MKSSWLLSVSLFGALLASGSVAARTTNVTDPGLPHSLPADGPVNVQWDDPANFTEIRYSRNRWESERGNWVKDIAEYVRAQAAKELLPGERLDVTIHDIKLAGDYEPWHGPNTNSMRVVRDIYPPRLTLSYTLLDASGQTISQGERKLTDLAFLQNGTLHNDTDPLRYEKRLVDDWLRRDMTAAHAPAAS
jgi:hypothetical protein